MTLTQHKIYLPHPYPLPHHPWVKEIKLLMWLKYQTHKLINQINLRYGCKLPQLSSLLKNNCIFSAVVRFLLSLDRDNNKQLLMVEEDYSKLLNCVFLGIISLPSLLNKLIIFKMKKPTRIDNHNNDNYCYIKINHKRI